MRKNLMRATRSAAGRLALALCAGASISACARHEPVAVATIPTEYRDRHPIVVAPAEESIDIFVRGLGRGLDTRQTLELRAIADDFRTNGQGHMTVLVPVGSYGPNRGASAVRAALAGAGVRGVAQSHYRVEGPASDQPIRVVYTKLKARVATKCGQWPDDIAGFQGTRSWSNEPYYNFGCAHQNMLANQVADPIDLVRGRAEDRIDTARRLRVIDTQRAGRDPSTTYRTTGTGINNAVGTN
jgi:pilus assembly protein CpaD